LGADVVALVWFPTLLHIVSSVGSVLLQPCMGCRCQGCVRCYNCLGRGFKRCISCHGSGRLWKSDPHGHRHVDSCWRCHGTGRKRYTCVDYLPLCVAASNCRIDSTAIRPPFKQSINQSINQSISLIATLRLESRIANDMQLKQESVRPRWPYDMRPSVRAEKYIRDASG